MNDVKNVITASGNTKQNYVIISPRLQLGF